VLVGGTGTGKTHLAIAITANVVRKGARPDTSTPSIW
jgi:DNA replication protein DnaC